MTILVRTTVCRPLSGDVMVYRIRKELKEWSFLFEESSMWIACSIAALVYETHGFMLRH